MKDLQSLRSVIWKDLDADALPEYLRETELNKLDVYCSLRLLKLISLQDGSYEWEKIQHVQLLKAYGKRSTEDKVDRHIFYTRLKQIWAKIYDQWWARISSSLVGLKHKG